MIEHTTPVDGNVFADIGFPPDEAENLLIRSRLMTEIVDVVRERGLRQKQAAELFGVSQPRISDVMRRKIDEFTIDSLVNMLGRAGASVRVTVRWPEAESGAEPRGQLAQSAGSR